MKNADEMHEQLEKAQIEEEKKRILKALGSSAKEYFQFQLNCSHMSLGKYSFLQDAARTGNLVRGKALFALAEQYKVTIDIDKHKLTKETPLNKTPLMIAAEHGHVQMVEFLLKQGANPNLQHVIKKITAFDLAEEAYLSNAAVNKNNCLTILELLDPPRAAPLIQAKNQMDTAVALGALLTLGHPLPHPPVAPPKRLTEAEQIQVIKKKLLEELQPDLPGFEFRLNAGAKSRNNFTLLQEAAFKNNVLQLKAVFEIAQEKQCELLIDRTHSKQSRSNGKTPLTLAVIHGHLECARLLIEKGADKNVISLGKTLLQLIEDKTGENFNALRKLLTAEQPQAENTNPPAKKQRMAI